MQRMSSGRCPSEGSRFDAVQLRRNTDPVTNISGDERHRCWPCYKSQFRTAMDHWG